MRPLDVLALPAHTLVRFVCARWECHAEWWMPAKGLVTDRDRQRGEVERGCPTCRRGYGMPQHYFGCAHLDSVAP